MTRGSKPRLFVTLGIFAWLLCVYVSLTFAQPAASKPPKTIFRDADGNLISNNEFVDLRLANPSGKDPATRTVLEDGTIEFRLAKVSQEGKVAPLFEAPTIDDKLLNAENLKNKVLVLNFWFIGCLGCMEELPKLNTLAKKYQSNDDVVFVSIAPNSPQELKQFRTREGFEYQMVGQARSIINLFEFSGFPRNIVIGKDGKIVYWRSTVRAWDKFESVIRAELNKN